MRGYVSRLVNFIGNFPTRAMEIFVGFVFMVDGLYVMSPLYDVARTSPISTYESSQSLQLVIGATYFIIGVVALLSATVGGNLSYRRIAAMSLFLGALFSTLFRIGSLGWHPSGWAFNFMLVGVFVFDWLHINKCLPLQKA